MWLTAGYVTELKHNCHTTNSVRALGSRRERCPAQSIRPVADPQTHQPRLTLRRGNRENQNLDDRRSRQRCLWSAAAEARDQIRIVGSSTVFPFSTAVAEQFGKSSNFSTPVVESTGTGGGMKLFCSGIGEDHPDVTNASRRMKKSEFDNCTKSGIDITEVKVGFDGIVLANAKSGADLDLTLEQLFLALAKEVPQDGKLVANPYTNWSEIDPLTAEPEDRSPRPAADERHARCVR